MVYNNLKNSPLVWWILYRCFEWIDFINLYVYHKKKWQRKHCTSFTLTKHNFKGILYLLYVFNCIYVHMYILLPYMYEWCINVYMARPPKIVIVLSVLPNWNKIVNQSMNQSIKSADGEITVEELVEEISDNITQLSVIDILLRCVQLGWLCFTSRSEVFYSLSSIFQLSQIVIRMLSSIWLNIYNS